MANDPNRDLLPVKDIDDRSSRVGINCRIDHNVISKLKRCDLEDRYMRLYDENTHIKKQLNCQEEKIKRLGTKLLRLMGEKKTCSDIYGRRQNAKGMDELQMRIIELEHENYTLKDRNIVLKQQLANHARHHVAAHKSPNRSVHTSPRISQRQSSAPNVNEGNYILTNRNQTQDVQLREAEEHINGLNKEIKSLHNKIDTLQQDLEKSSLENQKTKVCENIELIRLQRSLKQQSIQIASLQAQIKNSEKSQKLLRDELATAHKENEESLQVISDKQKEILDLYKKLEENNVCRLEQEEMRERINDLLSERDALRERGEFLMKTIETKSSEADIINDLKKMLSAEKLKKEELKQSLENTQKVLQSLKESARLSQSSLSDEGPSVAEDRNKLTAKLHTTGTQTIAETPRPPVYKNLDTDLELLVSTQLVPTSDERNQGSPAREIKTVKSVNRRSVATYTDAVGVCTCSQKSTEDSATQTSLGDFPSLPTEIKSNRESMENSKLFEAEKLNLERELEYVKQLLRSQTQRCETQDEEINRLTTELRVSEEKYNDTLKRLDLHLKIFRHLESRTGGGFDETESDAFERKYLSLLAGLEDGSVVGREEEPTSPRLAEERDPVIQESEISKKPADNAKVQSMEPQQAGGAESSQTYKDGRMRFMRRKYLDSSDDDSDDGEFTTDRTAIRSTDEKSPQGKPPETESSKKTGLSQKRSPILGMSHSDSSDSVQQLEAFGFTGRTPGEVRPIPKPRTELPKKAGEGSRSDVIDVRSPSSKKLIKAGGTISICIEWLKLEPETSVWYNDSVKLLFVDFSFLDVKGEETETPSSQKKPKKPVEKCYFNFTKSIEFNDHRTNALQLLRNRLDHELLVFKVVSEPEESNDDSDCIDIGVAVVTVDQFFQSSRDSSLLLKVMNVIDMKEVIGVLSVRLDISGIL